MKTNTILLNESIYEHQNLELQVKDYNWAAECFILTWFLETDENQIREL